MEYKAIVKDYFELNAEAWMYDAYENDGYNYPTPQHRLRIVNNIINKRNDIKSVIDLGCGGGALSIELARNGLNVLAIDQSDKMLEFATTQIAKESQEVKSKIKLEKRSIEDFNVKDYDAIISMGVIGYMPSDDVLFDLASKVLRDGGYYIVSFRNRLFNLYSMSSKTVNEANENQLEALIEESNRLYQKIDNNSIMQVLQYLHKVSGELLENGIEDVKEKISPSEKKGKKYSIEIEARQSTPEQATATALRYGFELQNFYGVHPHFSVPGLNKLLPPQVYNKLSDTLIPLESMPASLLWSSVFIGVFKKSK